MEVSGQFHTPAALLQEKQPLPFYRRLSNNNNNNNNNNLILYYLRAESTDTRPITDTAQCRYW
jgi:hypothetical protein